MSSSRGAIGLRIVLVGILHTPCFAQPENHKVGVLFWHDSPNDALAFDGFEAGTRMSRSRYEFEIRNVQSDEQQARKQLREFRDLHCDLVLALGTRAAQLAREEIRDLPVVYTAVTNPVLSSVADSWSSSAVNVAGNSNWIPAETLLRAFSRAVPDLKRLGVIASKGNPVSTAEIEDARRAIREDPKPGLELRAIEISDPRELTEATRKLVADSDAIWIPIDIAVYENLHWIRRVSDQARIPLLSSSHRGAEEGAILSIVVDYRNLGKNAAGIALRILEEGVDPASISVGRLKGYRTIVNLKRSREIGYQLPLEVLCTADRIIQ